MTDTDEILAEKAKIGDRIALRQLLDRNYDVVFRFSYRLLGSKSDSEDVAQDVCMRLVERLGSYRGESKFSTWLYRVVLNTCRDYKRRQSSIWKMQGGFAAYQTLDAENWADSDQKVRWLYLALDRLKPDLKETALLILAEEITQDAAAAILGVSSGTVAWRMSEVKKQLRAIADSDDE